MVPANLDPPLRFVYRFSPGDHFLKAAIIRDTWQVLDGNEVLAVIYDRRFYDRVVAALAAYEKHE